MTDDIKQAITLALAIWGSVTGTAALALRIIGQRKDRSRLAVRPELHYDAWEIPPKPQLKVRVVNTGRRPATVDQVFGVMDAPNLYRRILWAWQKRGRLPLELENTAREVTEGGEAVFSYRETPYTNVGVHQFQRILVTDKTGRAWRSPRRFGQAQLRATLAAELIHQKEIGTEGQRHVHIRLYKIGSAWRMLGHVSHQNSAAMPWREFNKRKDADAAIATFLERSQRFLQGELEADQVNEFS